MPPLYSAKLPIQIPYVKLVDLPSIQLTSPCIPGMSTNGQSHGIPADAGQRQCLAAQVAWQTMAVARARMWRQARLGNMGLFPGEWIWQANQIMVGPSSSRGITGYSQENSVIVLSPHIAKDGFLCWKKQAAGDSYDPRDIQRCVPWCDQLLMVTLRRYQLRPWCTQPDLALALWRQPGFFSGELTHSHATIESLLQQLIDDFDAVSKSPCEHCSYAIDLWHFPSMGFPNHHKVNMLIMFVFLPLPSRPQSHRRAAEWSCWSGNHQFSC